MACGDWIVTIDAAYPGDITDVPAGRLDFFLRLLEPHNAAPTVPLDAHRTLAVTLTIAATTPATAAVRAEAMVRETLDAMGLSDDDWCITAIEVRGDATLSPVQILPIDSGVPLARTA